VSKTVSVVALEDVMADAQRRVDAVLEGVLPRGEGPDSRLSEAMRYATLGGGKRLRPFLVLAAGGLFGGVEGRLVRAGAAIELIHSYSLVHDDLPAMDDDDLRRGRPTCHIAFDEATAILAGDALLTLAFEVLADAATHPDPAIRIELVRLTSIAAGARGMVGGQMIDLLAEHNQPARDVVIRMERMKTGAMIALACECGAVLGQAPGAGRAALRAYGEDLGLAFQIADDLLDAEGAEADVGKKVGKDLAAGKANAVAALGIAGAREEAARLARSAIERLAGFGGQAEILRRVARFVVERKV